MPHYRKTTLCLALLLNLRGMNQMLKIVFTGSFRAGFSFKPSEECFQKSLSKGDTGNFPESELLGGVL